MTYELLQKEENLCTIGKNSFCSPLVGPINFKI